MKNILNKIYPHPLFLITILFFTLLGRFRIICYFMLLIIIHELGHIITGLFFKWKINKIIILPFGCLTKFDIDINTNADIINALNNLKSVNGKINDNDIKIFICNSNNI